MIANRNYTTSEPLTWVGRFPVYTATALAGVHGVTMVLTALLMATAGSNLLVNPVLSALVFWPESVLKQGHVWQLVTYAFVNVPSIWLVIQLVLLAMFGGEVEKFIGRKPFLWLYGLLLVAAPVFLALLGIFGIGAAQPFFGSASLHFAVFLAFVFIYPRAEIFFGIQARWIGLVLVGINSLQLLAYGDGIGLGVLWLECAVVAFYLKYQGVGSLAFLTLPQFPKRSHSHSQKHLRVVRDEEVIRDQEEHDSIDPILEKISRYGIASLSRNERERLEKARAILLEKERTR